MSPTPKPFMEANGISNRDLLEGVLSAGYETTEASVSRMLNGKQRISAEFINATLVVFSTRLSRPVTYEEAFLGQAESAQKAS